MYPSLYQALEGDRPDYVVIDRYAFAGFDVCHKLDLPYAVNNPTLLLDLDQPPSSIPPPFAGLLITNETVWERSMHLLYRMAMRTRILQAFTEINVFRKENGIR